MFRTLDELATVNFARGDLKRNDVSLLVVSANASACRAVRTAASLRSLIGIPMVLVIVAVRCSRLKVDWECSSDRLLEEG